MGRGHPGRVYRSPNRRVVSYNQMHACLAYWKTATGRTTLTRLVFRRFCTEWYASHWATKTCTHLRSPASRYHANSHLYSHALTVEALPVYSCSVSDLERERERERATLNRQSVYGVIVSTETRLTVYISEWWADDVRLCTAHSDETLVQPTCNTKGKRSVTPPHPPPPVRCPIYWLTGQKPPR